MIHIYIDPKSGEIARQGLQDLASSYPKIGRLSLYRLAQAIFRVLGIEPAPWPGQVYKRTGTARASRRIEKTETGYIIYYDPVSTYRKRRTHYAVYLRGDPTTGEGQSQYFAGRWKLTAEITNEEMEKLPPEVVRLLKQAVQEANNATKSSS